MSKQTCSLLQATRTKFYSSGLPTSPASSIDLDEFDAEIQQETFHDFQFIKQLSNATFELNQVYSRSRDQKYALKVFRYDDDEINKYYLMESRFAYLKHENVVSIIEANKKITMQEGKNQIEASYILMELAICDFSILIPNQKFLDNDKLIRTYFHHLVEGLEYLHSQGVSHLDLKLHNLLLGQDYQLKITDFDISYRDGDIVVIGFGTKNFRAPELLNETCKKPKLADMYSLGILLFTFKFGRIPYLEDKTIKNVFLMELLLRDPERYWNFVRKMFGSQEISQGFKDLFFSLMRENPEERATFIDIKANKWYQESIYTREELAYIMRDVVSGGSHD